MAATFSSIADALKTQFLGPLSDQINSKTIFYDRMKRKKVTQGDSVKLSSSYSRNFSVGARATSGATLPTASQQSLKAPIFYPKVVYGRLKIEVPAIDAARNNAGAFANMLEFEMNALKRDFQHSLNRQLLHRGDAILTNCATTTASTTVNVDTTAFLEVGAAIDVITKADGTDIAASRTVSSITSDTAFVISGASITASAGDSIYVEDSRNLEIFGIDYAIATDDDAGQQADYGAIDRDSFAHWKAQALTASANRPLDTNLLQQALDEVGTKGGAVGDGISVWVCSPAIARAYGDNCFRDFRFQRVDGAEKQKLGYGYSGLHFGGIPFLTDKHVKKNLVYGVDESVFTQYIWKDINWMDLDGAVLSRVANEAAYEATLYTIRELAAAACNVNIRISQIEE